MTEIVILPAHERASLSPTQSGFAHGYGLFETIAFREGKLLFWDAHWVRLKSSAERLNISLTCTASEVLSSVRTVLQAPGQPDGLVKLSLLREGEESRLFVYTRSEADSSAVCKLILDTEYPINERSILAGHKTHNYLEAIFLLEQARQAGYYDALRLDTKGHLAETCIANLFFFEKGQWHTPSLACGVLPGVVRAALLSAFSVKEGAYSPEDLREAEAVLITNSGSGVVPVDSVVFAEDTVAYESTDNVAVRKLVTGFEQIEAIYSTDL